MGILINRVDCKFITFGGVNISPFSSIQASPELLQDTYSCIYEPLKETNWILKSEDVV